jgi:NAD(P)-dependent dehydrogenase (short-subunit alcohol dehydrogenase family)
MHSMDASRAADLTGRKCLVTGANRGIGLATSIELARAGAHVVLVCRDPARARAAVDMVRQAGAGTAEAMLADLSSQASIRQLADAFRKRHDSLDVLVNNAAMVSEHRRVTVDGRELTFAVNHLAYFLLTRLLIDLINAAEDGVVVNVAATNHRDVVDQIEDLDSDNDYDMRTAYKRSKLANVSFTLELARRLGESPRANAFCPDVVATDLLMQFRRVPNEQWTEKLAAEASPRTAALVALSLVTEPGTGRYLEEGVDIPPSPQARDPELAERLWRQCSVLTGLDPD